MAASRVWLAAAAPAGPMPRWSAVCWKVSIVDVEEPSVDVEEPSDPSCALMMCLSHV